MGDREGNKDRSCDCIALTAAQAAFQEISLDADARES